MTWRTWYNWLGMGFLGPTRLFDDKLLDELTDNERNEIVLRWRESFDMKPELIPTESFNTYDKNRLKNLDDFLTIKETKDGKEVVKEAPASLKNLVEKLKAAETQADAAKNAATATKDAITKALTFNDGTKVAMDKFNNKIKWMKDYIADPKSLFNPADALTYLIKMKDKAHKAITEQHATEKENLENLLKDDAFIKNLETSIGKDQTPEQINEQVTAIKKDMRSTLEENQKKEIAAFDKEIDDATSQMHWALAQERVRIGYLAKEWERNEEMRALINDLAAKNFQGGSEVTIDIQQQKALLKGIKVSDLPFLMSITGLKATREGNIHTLELPSYFNRIYYNSADHNTKADIKSIIDGVKSCGKERIKIKMSHPNLEIAMQLAREAYEAAVEAGYPEGENKDKEAYIVMEVNGQPKTIKELFENHPMSDATRKQARLNEEARKSSVNAMSTQESAKQFGKDIKGRAIGIRDQGMADEAAAAAKTKKAAIAADIPPTRPSISS